MEILLSNKLTLTKYFALSYKNTQFEPLGIVRVHNNNPCSKFEPRNLNILLRLGFQATSILRQAIASSKGYQLNTCFM